VAKPEKDPFGARTTTHLPEGATAFYRPSRLVEGGVLDSLDRLPFSIRILLENALRHAGGGYVSEEHVQAVARWSPTSSGADVPFMPTRVVLQDFTGVPAVVDLAAMRDGLEELGGDPARINPVVPADLVIDHSVQVDFFGFNDAFRLNVEKEFERNRERYALLRWAQEAFDNFSVVPPGTGIVHQVNLEYLASVIHRREHDGDFVAYPDTLVGHRLAHDHGERPRRGRVGRRGHRGRGGRARPALLHAAARGGGHEIHGCASRRAPPRPTSCSA
jgi:aconitate hydratase